MSKKLFQIGEPSLHEAIDKCVHLSEAERGDLHVQADILDAQGIKPLQCKIQNSGFSGGFKRGELPIIASPTIGAEKKTMFAEAMAREAGLQLAPILLEEDPERLKERLILMHPANHGKSQSLAQLLAGLRHMDPVAMHELANMHRRGGKASRVAEQITDVVLKDMLQPMDPEQAERKPESTSMVREIHPPETVIPFEERLEMAVEHWNMLALKVPPKIRTQMTPAEIDQWVAECTELMDANGVPQRYGQLFEAMMNRSHHQKHFHAPELVDKDIFGLIRRVSKVSKSKRKRK